MLLPRYPIYIPSKGRADKRLCLTAKFLIDDDVPFHLVVEPQEAEKYSALFGKERILVLPFSNLGFGSIPACNWIKDHATASGHLRHWNLNDNIRCIERRLDDKRIRCPAGAALAITEDFVDRYENIAVAGLAYSMFLITGAHAVPFYLNVHVYSCMLILNSIPHRWCGRYNEDTDLCLQVLADGWCTILMNIFGIRKTWTMTMPGGNTAELYQGDGRLKMARSLERMWPGVVQTKRRFRRPQHVIKNQWRAFDTPLKLKPGIDLSKLEPNEYGMTLTQVRPIKSKSLEKFVKQNYNPRHEGFAHRPSSGTQR